MTENEIKEMLKDIIDNGAEYEYTFKDFHGDYVPWKKYNLGEEICNYYEFRKVENWSVIEWEDTHKFEIRTLKEAENIIGAFIQITFKTKDECEKWIEEHTKKTWLEEYLDVSCDDKIEAHNSKIDIENVCKKILEEMDKTTKERQIRDESFPFYFRKRDIEQIIFHLGVEL